MWSDDPNYRLIQIQALGYFLVFTAFNAAQNLGGSLGVLDSYMFAVLYATFVFFCVPAPRLVDLLGPKYSMVIGAAPYFGVLVGHLLPPFCPQKDGVLCWNTAAVWIVKLILGAACGAGAALVWTGQGVYLSRAVMHAAAREKNLGASLVTMPMESDAGGAGAGAGAGGGGDAASAAADSERIGRLNKKYNGMFWSVIQFSGLTGLTLSFLVTTFVPGIQNALHWLFVGLSLVCMAGIFVLATCLPQLDVVKTVKTRGESGESGESGELGESGESGESGEALDGELSTVDMEVENVDMLATLHLCAYDARMRCLVPIIFYNGASLGFLWNVFNVLGWNTAVGLSFVALGSAFWFATNTIFTPIMSRLSESRSYVTSMYVATGLQALMYMLLITVPIDPVQCNPSGCATNTSGACWKPTTENQLFPFDCEQQLVGGGGECVVCSSYQAARAQKCDVGLTQCTWVAYPHGDALAPSSATMLLLFTCTAMFAVGDAVWETQLPSILQTVFDNDRDKSSALANLKMFQSIGVSLVFAFSYLNDLQLMSMILLVTLGWGTLCAIYAHTKIVNFDTGLRRSSLPSSSLQEDEQNALLSSRT